MEHAHRFFDGHVVIVVILGSRRRGGRRREDISVGPSHHDEYCEEEDEYDFHEEDGRDIHTTDGNDARERHWRGDYFLLAPPLLSRITR